MVEHYIIMNTAFQQGRKNEINLLIIPIVIRTIPITVVVLFVFVRTVRISMDFVNHAAHMVDHGWV